MPDAITNISMWLLHHLNESVLKLALEEMYIRQMCKKLSLEILLKCHTMPLSPLTVSLFSKLRSTYKLKV